MIPDAVFTLDKAKAHLRVTWPEEDALITAYLDAAVGACERYTRRAWTERNWTTHIPACATVDNAAFHSLLTPVKEAKVYALDGAGGENPVLAADTFLTTVYGHSVLSVRAWGFPLAQDGDAGRIEWKAEPDQVPPDVYAAAMLYLGDLYANREAHVTGTIVARNSLAEFLLVPYVLEMHA